MAFPALAKVAGSLASSAAGAAGGGGGVAAAAGKSASAVSSLAARVAELGASATKSGGMVGQFAEGIIKTLMDPLQMVKAIAGPISELVALANPSVVKQFTLAMNDAMAIFGQIAEPVLKGFTLFVRAFGDAWAKMVPVVLPLMEEFSQHLADTGYIAAQSLAAWAPLIQLLVDVMIPAVHYLTLGFAEFQGFLQELIKTIFSILGIKADRRDENRTSRGAAVRNASSTSVEGFAKSLFDTNIKNLFPGAKSKDPVAVNMEILEAMKAGQEVFKSIEKVVREILGFVKSAVDKAEKVTGAVGGVVDAVVPSKKTVGTAVQVATMLNPVGALVNILGRAKII